MDMTHSFAKIFAVFFVAFSGFVVGCAKSEAPNVRHEAAPPDANATTGVTRALATTVELRMRTSNVADATSKARAETESSGGYVSNGVSTGEGEEASAQIDLRVPKVKLGAVRKTLSTLGTVTYETEKVDDLTDQHADLDARLHNARVEEQRLLDLMKTNTGNLSDLLTTERELARVRETVEKLDAEKRTMDGTIELATIHLSITCVTSSAEDTPWKSIHHAWSSGVTGARAIAVYAMMVIATVSPTLLPLAAFALLVIFFARRVQRQRRLS